MFVLLLCFRFGRLVCLLDESISSRLFLMISIPSASGYRLRASTDADHGLAAQDR
ncbi:hypothetical protein BDV11DRAFT_190566 [Aspergillus similis]